MKPTSKRPTSAPLCKTCARPLGWMTKVMRAVIPSEQRYGLPLNGTRVCKNARCPSSPLYSPSAPLTTTRQLK